MFQSRRYNFRKTFEDVPSASKHVEDTVTIKILQRSILLVHITRLQYDTQCKKKYNFYILKPPILHSLTFRFFEKQTLSRLNDKYYSTLLQHAVRFHFQRQPDGRVGRSCRRFCLPYNT